MLIFEVYYDFFEVYSWENYVIMILFGCVLEGVVKREVIYVLFD